MDPQRAEAALRLSTRAPQLPGFLHTLAPYLQHYGYLAIALIVLVESFGPPLPGETIIIAGSVYAAAGRLNIVAVALVALAAAVVGDNIAYLIGRRGGRALVTRYGRYVGATEQRYAAAEGFFRRRGVAIVVVARFIEGLRQLNGLVAGTSRMPYLRFALAQLVGGVLWVGTWTAVGDAAGAHLTGIYDGVERFGYVLLALAAAAIVALVLTRRRRRRSARSRAAGGGTEH